MDIQIYGINMFTHVVNWFASIYAFILLLVITGAVGYLFYKLNFTEHAHDTEAVHHYGFNIALIGFYGVVLFWVSKYVLKMDLIMSVIFTGIFYSVSIFVLTITMIFMRRSKLKKYVIKSAKWINDNPTIEWKDDYNNPIYKIRMKCIEADHQYTDWLKTDIDRRKKSEKPIDLAKYEAINIWENKNMDSDIKEAKHEPYY